MDESQLWGVIAGCFSAGAVFGVLYVLWWRREYSREAPPSLFVAKERWEKQKAYPRPNPTCLSTFCVVQ